MDNKQEKKAVNEELLDHVSGGYYWADAECNCPACGHWIRPIGDKGRFYCPDCRRQVGGLPGGTLLY